LNLKEFVVPMSLEVGRIIRGFEKASTFNFKKLKYKREIPRKARHNTFSACETQGEQS